MKRRTLFLTLVIIMGAGDFLQGSAGKQIVQNQPPVAIEIPVRVTQAGRFVDRLTLADFEVIEDGVPQNIEALFLVRRNQLERKEGARGISPRLSRNFYLLFQMADYDAKIAEAISYLFERVYLPGDTLTIMTPQKPYTLSQEAFEKKPREILAKDMLQLLRKDIQNGSSEYRNLIRDLQRIVKSISGIDSSLGADMEQDTTAFQSGAELLLPRYKSTLQKLETMRFVDENKFVNFARFLRRQEGQNAVFFFYQREFRPELSGIILNKLESENQDKPNILGDLQELFMFYNRQATFNAKNIQKAFADSSVNFNFLFMDRESKYSLGVIMREQSEDVFPGFTEIAMSTGGIMDNSQNTVTGFKKAVENLERYYLLVYTPRSLRRDGAYKNIKVTVKDGGLDVRHRAGYFDR